MCSDKNSNKMENNNGTLEELDIVAKEFVDKFKLREKQEEEKR